MTERKLRSIFIRNMAPIFLTQADVQILNQVLTAPEDPSEKLVKAYKDYLDFMVKTEHKLK